MTDLALWQYWSVWMAAGVLLVILEMFVPGFVLLGFGIGALVVGAIFWLSTDLIVSLPMASLIFGMLSLLAWLGLRMAFKPSAGNSGKPEEDINDY